MENNYGWICPKCGCPNSPTNETCVACFLPEVYVQPVYAPRCIKCGMDLSKPLGFVCPDYSCPGRSGITSFNPLNAASNFELPNQHSCTNIREEDDL